MPEVIQCFVADGAGMLSFHLLTLLSSGGPRIDWATRPEAIYVIATSREYGHKSEPLRLSVDAAPRSC
jgi:hypothetical protein